MDILSVDIRDRESSRGIDTEGLGAVIDLAIYDSGNQAIHVPKGSSLLLHVLVYKDCKFPDIDAALQTNQNIQNLNTYFNTRQRIPPVLYRYAKFIRSRIGDGNLD